MTSHLSHAVTCETCGCTRECDGNCAECQVCGAAIMAECATCGNVYDTQHEANACCAITEDMLAREHNPREKHDDDGREYADPRDFKAGLE